MTDDLIRALSKITEEDLREVFGIPMYLDPRMSPDTWALCGTDAGLVTVGSHRVLPEAVYARLGYAAAPAEGRFAFRLRAELSTGLQVVDRNALRERLYLVWRRRQKLEPVFPLTHDWGPPNDWGPDGKPVKVASLDEFRELFG